MPLTLRAGFNKSKPMDKNETENFDNQMWDDSIIPELCEYIRIPNKSPMFDPDWEKHGYMDQAVQQIERWSREQPIKGMQARRQFDDPEIGVDVKCDVHGWMQGYVHVLDNPFYAVTGGDGAFDLGSLPSGNYVVEAWHATLGSVTQSVEISAGQPASLELRFR